LERLELEICVGGMFGIPPITPGPSRSDVDCQFSANGSETDLAGPPKRALDRGQGTNGGSRFRGCSPTQGFIPCPSRKSYPGIAMVQSGKNRRGDDRSRPLDSSP